MVSHCQRGRGGGGETSPGQGLRVPAPLGHPADPDATLCCHEILMVEEAEEGRGEEAGGDPPGEEGEEAPEEQGAEHGPQAPQGHGQLGDRRPGPRLSHRRRGRRRRSAQRVHLVGAGQLLRRVDPPGVGAWERGEQRQRGGATSEHRQD